jgi:LPXTG-motif cell wall-anchored protein
MSRLRVPVVVVAAVLAIFVPASAQAETALPTTVTVAGSLNSEMGCPGDWQPDCAAAHLVKGTDDVFRGTYSLPAGSYEYKAAINDDWTESYGLNGTNANIPVTVGADPVTFYYDPVSHWITDNVNSLIVTAAGSFQSEVGCSGDWDPACLRTWLEDIDGDGIYSLTVTLPAGSYEYKIAFGEGWDGAVGGAGGANLAFTLAGTEAVTITYNAKTGEVTGPPAPQSTTPEPTSTTGTTTSSGGVLPTTGSSTPLWLVVAGVVAVLAGLALALVGRRRRTAD